MLDDVFVIDGTSHAYNFSPENRIGGSYPDNIAEGVYQMHSLFTPADRRDLVIDRESFENRICNPEVEGRSMFGESHTDICIYHELPLFGYFKDGGSPLSIGVQMRDRWPGRVLLYGGISPHQQGALERVDELVEQYQVSGIKLYPHDLVAGELRSIRMDDQDLVFPLFERAEKLGLRTVAVHKAIVMGQVPLEPYFPFEVGEAAKAFPNLTFEIVHGGWAFLEETAFLIQWYPNISVSLEGTSALLLKAPRKFAEIIGTIMAAGGAERIIWGIGGAVLHSRLFEEAFWNFDFPGDLVEGYGIPPLTEEVKRGILGLNAARQLGLDVEELKLQIKGDEFMKPRTLAAGWSCLNAVPAS